MSVCLRVGHKLNTMVDKVDVSSHEDLVLVDSVHLVKVFLVGVRLPLAVELECPSQSEAVVVSHTVL